MKLLLHACCGPCAAYPIEHLLIEKVEFDIYYYNPNIHPLEEHKRRGEALKFLANQKNIKVIYSTEIKQNDWENYKGEMAERCKMCYRSRLEEVAIYAKRNGYGCFSSTLLISPYQDHDLIKEIGEEVSINIGISFYYKDFRPSFREGQNLAKSLAIYRQKYCGCICSLNGNGR